MVHSLYQSLNNLETIYADRIGIRYYDEAKGGVVEVPFRQYAADLRRFVAFLRSRTPNPLGQRVAILARNSYHYVMCLYGAVLAGAVAVPLNTGKNWDEIRYELDLVEPVCVLHDGEYLSREPALGQVYGDRLVPMDAFTAFEPAMDITEVPDLSALAFIMFTSGTTGRSKGVMLSQKNLFTAMPAFLTPFEDVRSQTGWNTDAFSSLSCLPMFHISAMTSLVSWSVTGHCVNLCNDLKYFYRDLGAMRSDVMAVVPVLLKSIYHDVMKGKRERLNGLRVLTCGAAMFDPAVLQDLMDRGFFIAQMYGLTETCGDGAWNSSQEEKYLTSVGHVDDSCQYKLEDGELCMLGDPVMLGYYKDPEATAQVLDAEGWFHTGDIARVEPDGYMYMTGRKKNVIILGSGENVSPEELEKLLAPCAAIRECRVFERNQRICAVVCCEADQQDAVRDFVTEVNRTLPLYKRMVVEFSAQPLPRNAAGKLLRS
jgi:long-chain acyl-CoA synthetase